MLLIMLVFNPCRSQKSLEHLKESFKRIIHVLIFLYKLLKLKHVETLYEGLT